MSAIAFFTVACERLALVAKHIVASGGGGRLLSGEDFVRFWLKVGVKESRDACWLWEGSGTPLGYGQFRGKSRALLAHRASFEDTYGPIAKGLVVRHLCDVRACVNPFHLASGTQLQNIQDKKILDSLSNIPLRDGKQLRVSA